MGCPSCKITTVGGVGQGSKRVKRRWEDEIEQIDIKLKIFVENVWIISCDLFGNDENYSDHATPSRFTLIILIYITHRAEKWKILASSWKVKKWKNGNHRVIIFKKWISPWFYLNYIFKNIKFLLIHF